MVAIARAILPRRYQPDVYLHNLVLKRTGMVVITELLWTRFEGSHRIEQIWEELRSARDYPFRTFYTCLLPDRFLRNVVSEWRSERQSWLWMRPR